MQANLHLKKKEKKVQAGNEWSNILPEKATIMLGLQQMYSIKAC